MNYKGYTIKTTRWLVSGRERFDAAVYSEGKLVDVTKDTHASRKDARVAAARMIDDIKRADEIQGVQAVAR